MSMGPETVQETFQETGGPPGWIDGLKVLTYKTASNRFITGAFMAYAGAEAKSAEVNGHTKDMAAATEELVTGGGHLPVGYLGALIASQAGLAISEKIKLSADRDKERKRMLAAALGGASLTNIACELVQDAAANQPAFNFITNLPLESLKDAGVAAFAGLVYFVQARWRQKLAG